MNRNQQDQRGQSYQESEFYFRLILQTFANYSYLLHREHFGREYFGLSTMLSLIAPVVMSVFLTKDIPPTYLPILSLVFLFLLIMHRSEMVRRPAWMRVHSKYQGYPRFCKHGTYTERAAKQWAEPFATVVVGLMLCVLDQGVSVFMVICGVAAAIDSGITEAQWNQRLRRMEDAEIESECLFDAFDRRDFR